jgi:hypothetical protein
VLSVPGNRAAFVLSVPVPGLRFVLSVPHRCVTARHHKRTGDGKKRMNKDQCNKRSGTEAVGDVLARLMAKVRKAAHDPEPEAPATEPTTDQVVAAAVPPARDGPAVYDFDLAEFPLFSFAKRPARDRNAPLTYTDTIRGRAGRPVTRTWTAYPGRLGVGGATAHALLFDLLQLYAEQGGRAPVIHFGTLRSLYLRRGARNPSKTDYDRMRRDFAVLRGYDFSCKNAYWDARRRAYVDMDWRLFGAVRYFKAGPGDGTAERPHGQIELSPTFRAALQDRGLFRLGFEGELFHRLPPLAQRLAVYLAKMFTYQTVHRRRVADLARVLPVETRSPADARKVLGRAVSRLLDAGLPILASHRIERGCDGIWWAVFRRGASTARIPAAGPRRLGQPHYQVERIIAAVAGESGRRWWTLCVERLGPGPVDRAIGLLREAQRAGPVENPGGLLTKILKDLAAEAGVRLTG